LSNVEQLSSTALALRHHQETVASYCAVPISRRFVTIRQDWNVKKMTNAVREQLRTAVLRLSNVEQLSSTALALR